MSGGGSTDASDPDAEAVVLDWSYQNHTEGLLRGGKHCGSNFKRAILDNADLTEGDFSECNFSKASMVGADLMNSAFDGADFRNVSFKLLVKPDLLIELTEINSSKKLANAFGAILDRFVIRITSFSSSD